MSYKKTLTSLKIITIIIIQISHYLKKIIKHYIVWQIKLVKFTKYKYIMYNILFQ